MIIGAVISLGGAIIGWFLLKSDAHPEAEPAVAK